MSEVSAHPSPAATQSDYQTRFSGIARLYGQAGLERLQASHVCIVGIGGVGTWVAEAVARSGIGKITLVDLDDICLSNVNRQLHALDGTVGKPKTEEMAARIRLINPACEVVADSRFFTARTAPSILDTGPDLMVDAIDNIRNKCELHVLCRERGIPTIASGGAGGRRDPGQVQVADLSKARYDRLLQITRKRLRQKYGFPKAPKKMGVMCVFSPEPVVYPGEDGTVCSARPEDSDLRLNCDAGYGTATFVTGAFGFAAAGWAVKKLALAE